MVRELETSLVTASPYSLISFPEIRNVDMDYLIDVMGILVGVGQDRVYERNGVTTKFKVIELESDGIRIECALFGSYVDELDAYLQSGYNQNVVVLAQFLKVKMFNGKSQLQNAMNCTKLLFNPEIPESVSFKLKHSHNFDSPTQPLTHKKDTSHLSLEEEFLSLFQRMTIEELKDCQNDMVCVVFGTVKHILGEGDWWYGACVCNKGVVIESKRFFCSKCKKYVWTIVPRYRIKVRVVDDTDSATFVIFDHDGISLTNKSCLNLLHEMDQDPQSDTVPKEIGDLVEKQFLFKIEAKNDVNSNFEKSFRVKKLCGDLDIIKKFKYVAVEKVDAGLDNDIEGGVTNDLNNKFEEEATDDKYQVPNSVHVPIPVEYDSDDCTPLKRGFIEVADDNDGVNSKNVKNVKIEKE
ncbi:replication factor A protein 1-like [Cicer arietinum]|uniref:Uncharacterized protein LOC101506477 n=2 Tax=Cicer arietinum TaxID=3827 RepID=A0A3Q7XFU1_CICAR|nr:uncharacterized protein LOC101506477 [Cicer arietinum]